MLIIIDYQIGNLASIQNMLKKAGVSAVISADPAVIATASKLILPGVGSFDYGMEKLHESGLVEVLNKKVLEEKTPILGICLGMQLLTKSSEEGIRPGLGWIDAQTVKFNFGSLPDTIGLKVPHMGWSEVLPKKESALFKDMFEENRFYFVHSYHVKCNSPADILLTSNYGYDFTCAVERGNILGVQFHPEKSHKFGLKLLKNFAENY